MAFADAPNPRLQLLATSSKNTSVLHKCRTTLGGARDGGLRMQETNPAATGDSLCQLPLFVRAFLCSFVQYKVLSLGDGS